MRSVDIGIGHYYYLVVCKLGKIYFFRILLCTDSDTHGPEKIQDFLAFKHLMINRFLYIKDLTAQRKYGLELSVASLLGASSCRVTLDYEQFAILCRTARAIG